MRAGRALLVVAVCLSAFLPSQVTDASTPVARVGTVEAASVGLIGCLETLFWNETCVVAHAVPDGVKVVVLATSRSMPDELPIVPITYVEEAVVGSDALTVHGDLSDPVVRLQATLPRTGEIDVFTGLHPQYSQLERAWVSPYDCIVHGGPIEFALVSDELKRRISSAMVWGSIGDVEVPEAYFNPCYRPAALWVGTASGGWTMRHVTHEDLVP